MPSYANLVLRQLSPTHCFKFKPIFHPKILHQYAWAEEQSNFEVFGDTSGLSLLGADILSFNLLEGSGKGLDALERIFEHTSTKL
jgi:hypothetical protein